MAKILIKNGLIINRGKSKYADVLIVDDRIEKVDSQIDQNGDKVIDAAGKWVIPGIIDDQVHFRQPGLEYKGDIYTESRAALAGGVTSFMEMPNTKPPAVTQRELQKKYTIAAASAITNFSFYMGATNDNIEQVLKTDQNTVCGIKVFMGSSTGNMLVDNQQTLENLFSMAHMIIATHCEDETTIRANKLKYENGKGIDASYHPIIRSREGCYLSSSMAVELAKKHGSRLHILHISTKEELDLFQNGIALKDKLITAEGCVHHMYFNSEDYKTLGNKIQCNPAIKDEADRSAILAAVIDDRIDVIATDHAPHTLEEKNRPYGLAPSGLPLIQHTLTMMLKHYHSGTITKEKIVEKMCHNPAILFQVADRGFIDQGQYADIAIVDPDIDFKVKSKDRFSKCGWSPLDGTIMKGRVERTFVNGVLKYSRGRIINQSAGSRLLFDR